MGVFGGIKGAKYSDGGVYIEPGVGRVEIVAIKYMKTRKGQDAFIVEVKMLESNNPDRPAGSLCTWMVTLDKEPSLGNIKQFVETLIPDVSWDQRTEAECEAVILAICAEAGERPNPLKGYKARFSATSIQTKANRPFTKVKWFPDTATEAEIAKAS